MIGPLTRRLAGLCAETAPLLGFPATRTTVETLGTRLAEPRNDLAAIEAVRSSAGGLRLGAANMIGELSRIDTLSGDDDPWPAARRPTSRRALQPRTALRALHGGPGGGTDGRDRARWRLRVG